MSSGLLRIAGALVCSLALCTCVALLYGCTPAPVVPTPDSGDAAADADTDASDPPPVVVDAGSIDAAHLTGCALACANMSNANCGEGKDSECVKTCTVIQGSPNFIYAFPLACLEKASTKAAVQKCGVVCK